MIHPYDLIGLKYRLGADPERHGAADCVTLARAVLRHHNVITPEPQRAWYRRLRKGDTQVFKDELERWGEKVSTPKIGSVALCHSPLGYGLATFFEDGWIYFAESVVQWNRTAVLPVVAVYCCRSK